MMKCDRQWEVTNKCIQNKYILCSKPVDEFSLRGPYVGILGYVVGRLYLLKFKNCILKKTAMNLINILEYKIYTFIYIYD